jgi:hypothetical protein
MGNDRLARIHDIGTKIEPLAKAIGALAGGVGIAVAALMIDLEAQEQSRDEFCIGSLQLFSAREFKPDDVISPVAVRIVTERCGLSEKEAAGLLASAGAARQGPAERRVVIVEPSSEAAEGPTGGGGPSVAEEQTLTEPQPSGWVALGAVAPETYSQVNFDRLDSGRPAISGDGPPGPGAVLRARWPVNLRTGTAVTTGGDNPVLQVIGEGACLVTTGASETHRALFWAPVEKTDCG